MSSAATDDADSRGTTENGAWPAWIRESGGGRPRALGLKNTGHLCYRNIVLQSLLHLPYFINLTKAIRDSHPFSCQADDAPPPAPTPSGGAQGGGDCVACRLWTLITVFWGQDRPPTPDSVRLAVNYFWEPVVENWAAARGQTVAQLEGADQDASELLNALIQQIRACSHTQNLRDRVDQTFYLQTVRISECPVVGCTAAPGRFPDQVLEHRLQLLPAQPERGLNELWQLSFAPQPTPVKNEVCAAHPACTKTSTLRIQRSPDVLCVQVNRFTVRPPATSATKAAAVATKCNARVPFGPALILPADQFDPQLHTRQAHSYYLSSVQLHTGSRITSGHWTAGVRTPAAEWALMNDDGEPTIYDTFKPLALASGVCEAATTFFFTRATPEEQSAAQAARALRLGPFNPPAALFPSGIEGTAEIIVRDRQGRVLFRTTCHGTVHNNA